MWRLKILEFKNGGAVSFTVKLLLQSIGTKPENREATWIMVLQLHFVSKNVGGFLWTPPPMLWRVRPQKGELRCCQHGWAVCPAAYAYPQACVPWSLWSSKGQCRVPGNQILPVPLEYDIKYVWGQRQRLSTSRKPEGQFSPSEAESSWRWRRGNAPACRTQNCHPRLTPGRT